MIWFYWVLWHINHYRLFNAKSSLHIYIKYMISKHIFELFFITQLNEFSFFNPIRIILITINDLLAHSLMFSSVDI